MAVLDDGFWNQRVQVFPGHDDVHLRWGRLRLQQVRLAFGSRFGKSSDCQWAIHVQSRKPILPGCKPNDFVVFGCGLKIMIIPIPHIYLIIYIYMNIYIYASTESYVLN